MITLARTTDKLEAFLSGAAATTEPLVTVFYHEVIRTAKGDVSEYPRGPQFTTLAGATETTILDAPGDSETCKHVDSIVIPNPDTAAITVTIVIDRSGSNRLQMKATLGVGYVLHGEFYLGGRGWYVTDDEGSIQTSLGPVGQFTDLTVSGNTTLGDAAADTVTINAESVSQPNIPCFLAYNSATDTNQTGNGAVATVDFDTEVFDQSGDFAADTFTAPATGKYLLHANVRMTNIPAGATTFQLRIATSARAYDSLHVPAAATFTQMTMTVTALADMTSGHTATVQLTISGGAGDTASIAGTTFPITFFCGRRVA